MFPSSLVNQTIYGIMKPQFREAFKKTFMCGLYDGEIRNQIWRRSVIIMKRPIDMNSNDIDINLSQGRLLR